MQKITVKLGIIAGLFSLLCFQNLKGQEWAKIYGRITDEDNNPVSLTHITVPNTRFGALSEDNGKYSLKLPARDEIELVYSCIGYEKKSITINTASASEIELNITLKISYKELDEVWIAANLNDGSNLTRIEIKDFNLLPNTTGNIETLLKTLPGVSSSNELSSQYSVRGGNFDENLVYVNDIEIYRPFLIRSGQQEGLSFINSSMVKSVEFSAGGFGAKYGDKLSSVLDIKYKKPKKYGGSASLSLLGASLHFEGISKDQKFTHITGFRYKTNQYLLNTLDTKGEYQPSFADVQTFWNYDFSEKFSIGFLGNYSLNNYLFIPETRESKFGTFREAKNIKIYYEGQENDRFETLLGALSMTYQPVNSVELKLIGSAFNTSEAETFDILGEYLINELDNVAGSKTFGDSIKNIGIGKLLDHARNYLDATIISISHKGSYTTDLNTLVWGVKMQHETIRDEVSEWEVIDSAGYSLPYSDKEVLVDKLLKSRSDLGSKRVTGYLQNTRQFVSDHAKIFLTLGVRAHYWSLNEQTVISPRASVAYNPFQYRNTAFRFAAGYYYQPPFFKELRNNKGEINLDLKAQKSIHFIAGSDFLFSAWNRPFKLSTELYYKSLDNLIPYKIDNVRIQYSGLNRSVGYAYGIEFKLNGEFVPGAESWASLSFMKTEEDIIDDYYFDEGLKQYPGYFPRPTNQYVNFGMFFQDYFPNNPDYKVHLTMHYGSRLPFTNPNTERYDVIYWMRAYRRIDIGLSKALVREHPGTDGNILERLFDNVWLNAEIFNLFGFDNTSSYFWVRTISNLEGVPNQFAVPNFLTSRRFNLKLTAIF